MDVGADDVEDSEEGIIAYFPLDKFTNAVSKLDGMGIQNNASVMYKPFQTLTLEEKRKATLEKLIDSLEDLDDVNKVYSNAE
jgi:transcriptional/translational regulatory protein YebC/TACO1